MGLTLDKLLELVHKLEDARRGATGPGTKHFCEEPRLGEDGKPYRVETKKSGEDLEISHGPHGRAFLAINPSTGGIYCAACRAGGA
jgi:hypothetical protein